MKNYVKPTIDVVELSVKENMAVLPEGVTGTTKLMQQGGLYGDVYTTVYDLAAVSTSALA